ncbi:hypothetical protein ACRRTK_014468 [Alexandromys fortis]
MQRRGWYNKTRVKSRSDILAGSWDVRGTLKASNLHAQGPGPGFNDPTGKENVPLSLQFGAWIGIRAKAWTSKQLCAGPRLSPVRAPRRSARLGVPLGLAGLGGWREGGGLRGCLRSTGARAAPAPLVSALRLLAAGRAGVPAPSRRPVSAALARGRGRGGPAARNFLRGCAGGGAAVRAPGRPRGGGGERSLRRRRIPRCGRKRLCEELPGTPSPPRLERPRGGCEPRAGQLPGSRSRGRAAGRPSGRGTKGRWAFLLFV